jgi:hypothetical protein
MKSSAVSVSRFPALGRWDSAPSRLSGVPVLKKKDSAKAGVASHTPAINVTLSGQFFSSVILLFGF